MEITSVQLGLVVEVVGNNVVVGKPASFQLMYSDDDSTWTEAINITTIEYTEINLSKVYSFKPAVAAMYWGVVFTSTASTAGTTAVIVAEIYLNGTEGTYVRSAISNAIAECTPDCHS